MPQISITYDRSLWETRLGGGTEGAEKMNNFLSDLQLFTQTDLSKQFDISISMLDVATGNYNFTFPSPTTTPGFDMNDVMKSGWGNSFIGIFFKHNINFFQT